MAIVWQNSFDGPHFTSISVENSADYGDPLYYVESPATYFSEGWVAHGISSARLGGESGPGRLYLDPDYLPDWSIRWYSYIPEDAYQVMQLGSWIVFGLDPGTDLYTLANESVEDHVDDLLGQPIRVELSSVDRQITARVWWGNIHSVGEPDLEVQGTTTVAQLSSVIIEGRNLGDEDTFIDEVAVAEGEWIGPVVDGFDTEAELGLGVSTSAEGEISSLGGHLQTGAQVSAEVFAGMESTSEVTTGVGTDVDVTWSTSEEPRLTTAVKMIAGAESISYIPDPPEIPPRVRFAIYSPSTQDLQGYIYNPVDWKLSIPKNRVGSLIFSISEHSPEYQAIAGTNYRFDVGVEIENSSGDFREERDCRFIALKRTRDYVDRTATVTWTCPAYSWIFNKIRVVDGLNSDGKRVFENATPGDILYPLMLEAHIRESFNTVYYQWMEDGRDYDDVPWEDDDISLEISRGDTYLNVLNTLADMGSIDWYMWYAWLQVFNKNSIDDDKTNEVYYPFESLIEHREEITREEMAGRIYSRNDKGNFDWVERTNRRSPWGMWEDLVDLPGSLNVDEMFKVVWNILESKPQNNSVGDITEVLTFVVKNRLRDPIPAYNYKVGDRISIDWINVSGEIQRRSSGRIIEMNLSGGDDDRSFRVSLTLGKRSVDPVLRLRNKMSNITSNANHIIGSPDWMSR